jgi:hypothetical protein
MTDETPEDEWPWPRTHAEVLHSLDMQIRLLKHQIRMMESLRFAIADKATFDLVLPLILKKLQEESDESETLEATASPFLKGVV